MPTVKVRITDEKVQKLSEYAKAHDIPMADVIRLALDRFMEEKDWKDVTVNEYLHRTGTKLEETEFRKEDLHKTFYEYGREVHERNMKIGHIGGMRWGYRIFAERVLDR